MILSCMGSFGQVTDTIEISLDFNAYLVFESDNIKFNFGSRDIKVDRSENKLIVEALMDSFYTTNMIVECDNKFYMFIIKFSESPKKFIHSYIPKANIITGNKIEKKSIIKQLPILIDSSKIITKKKEAFLKDSSEKEYKNISELMFYQPQKIKRIGAINNGITAVVTNINIIDNKTVIKLVINNESDIDYEIDYHELVINNKPKFIKKNASQEIKLNILYCNDTMKKVNANEKREVVFVLDKLTISKKKEMIIRLVEYNKERSGDRNFSIAIPYQFITKAKAIY